MELISTMLVYDSCDSCEATGVCVSVVTTKREWTLCSPCLSADRELMEVTDGF